MFLLELQRKLLGTVDHSILLHLLRIIMEFIDRCKNISAIIKHFLQNYIKYKANISQIILTSLNYFTLI